MTPHDRRRVALATAFTVIALPALLVISRDEVTTSGSPATGAAVDGATEALLDGGSATTTTTDYVPEAPVFIDGERGIVPPAEVNIAVPPEPGDDEAEATASFVRFADEQPRGCSTGLAPSGRVLTVVNTDNGRVTSCVNTFGKRLLPGIDIVLHTDVFAEIGDLADAPLPVRISW